MKLVLFLTMISSLIIPTIALSDNDINIMEMEKLEQIENEAAEKGRNRYNSAGHLALIIGSIRETQLDKHGAIIAYERAIERYMKAQNHEQVERIRMIIERVKSEK